MTNTVLLNEKIRNANCTKGTLATTLKLSRGGLWKKLSGQTEFTVAEMTVISDVLGLSDREKINIFFAQ